jgi:hypothetical protein
VDRATLRRFGGTISWKETLCHDIRIFLAIR